MIRVLELFAGNSIVVNVLEAILRELLPNEIHTKSN